MRWFQKQSKKLSLNQKQNEKMKCDEGP